MTRYVSAGSILAAALGLALVLAGPVSPAGAQDRAAGTPPARDQGLFPHKVVVPPGGTVVVQPSSKIIAPGTPPVPISPYSYPVYSAYSYTHPVVPNTPVPARRRWVPGYWARQWVPQYYTYDVPVPGHFDGNGLWVDGHYEPQVLDRGYFQQVWVPGSWTP
jgi:hypothetical protein